MKSLIDFTVDASKNPALGKEMNEKLKAGNAAALRDWFLAKQYHVSLEECQKMVENKDHLSGGSGGDAAPAAY